MLDLYFLQENQSTYFSLTIKGARISWCGERACGGQVRERARASLQERPGRSGRATHNWKFFSDSALRGRNFSLPPSLFAPPLGSTGQKHFTRASAVARASSRAQLVNFQPQNFQGGSGNKNWIPPFQFHFDFGSQTSAEKRIFQKT